jgi:outer membrane lipoprotein SlyB
MSISRLPIVKLAAAAVIVASGIVVGVMTGLVPGAGSQEPAPPAVSGSTGTPAPVIAPPIRRPAPVAASAPTPPPSVRPPPPAQPACADCGVVQSVQEIEVQGDASGAGAVAGGAAGLIIGNQIGDGKKKRIAKVIGAVGGALAGHQIEKNMKRSIQHEIIVRMDDGSTRQIMQASAEGIDIGDRVKVLDNVVVRN